MDMETQMENTKSPLVSVVIPTKNRKNLLSMAINSVLTQTYKNIQLIVQDNNSTDGTSDIMTKFQEDERVEYFRESRDLTMTENWNTGHQYARGDYFVRLDDDNVYFNNYIETSIQAIKTNNLDLITFSAVYLDLPDGLFGEDYLHFEADDHIHLLDENLMTYMEFRSLTDSNYSMYSSKIITDILSAGENMYTTNLPDRYLNYRIAHLIGDKGYRVGFSSQPMGISRYDYRPRQKSGYTFKRYDYSNVLESLEIQAAEDCQINFNMHRALTLKYFFDKHPSSLHTFFDSNVLSPENYRAYIEIGHLLESQQEYRFLDLYEYNAAAVSIIWALVKYPLKKIERENNLYFLVKFILKLVLHNLRSLRNIMFSIKNTGDTVNQEKGDQISLDIINNSYQLASIHNVFDFKSEVIDFVNQNNSRPLRNKGH